MGIEQLIKQTSSIFGLESSKRIVSALHQDQLAWKSLENPELQSSFVAYAAEYIERWTIGHLVRHILITNNIEDSEYTNLSNYLSESDKSVVIQNFQTTKKTLLPPVDLYEVGLLALYLREYRINNGNWQGINELFSSFKDLFKVWSTVFAALPAFIPDIESYYIEFLSDSANQSITQKTASVIHALLCYPNEDSNLLNILHNIFSHVNLEAQISSLHVLTKMGRAELAKLLAEDYLKLRENLSFFSIVLTKYQLRDNADGNQNTNNLQASLLEIDILQKLATLYHFAEKPKFSSQILALANKLLIQNQANLLNLSAQELAKFSTDQAISNWESALILSPSDDTILLNYTDFLIDTGRQDQLNDLLSTNSKAVKTKMLLKQVFDLKSEESLNLVSQVLIQPIINQQVDHITQDNWAVSQFDTFIAAAKLFQAKKSYGIAQKYVNQALELRPNDIEGLKLAAEIHKHNAELNESVEKYSLVRLLEPDLEQNHINLIEVLIKQRQYQKAFTVYDELFVTYTNPTRAQLLKYADLAEKSGKTDFAIPICKKILSADPLDGEALITLGNAYINTGQETLAIEIMEKAAAIAPEKPESWIALAKIWSRLGARERVIDSLQKARIALPADPIILTTLGKSYLENELAADALPLLKEAYQLNPNSLETKINLADALHKLGYCDEAWHVLEDLHNEYTVDPKLAFILGQIKHDMGYLNEAHQFLRFAWLSSPDEDITTSYSKLLLDLKEQDNNSEAELSKIDQELEEILHNLQNESNDQMPFEKRLLFADIKNALGQHQKAYDEYLCLLSDPSSKSSRVYSSLQYKIGNASIKLKLHEEGLAALQEAVVTEPNNHHFRRALAEAYIRFELTEDAKSSAKAALQISPHDLDNILWYSNFMVNNGEPQKAISSLKDAIFDSPNNRELYISLSRLYISLGDYASAKSTLNDMINLQDVSIHEMTNAANIFYHLNDVEQASSVLKQAINKNSQKSFWDLDEIVRALLLIGEIETAKELIIENEAIYESLPEFIILKSDVLIASNLLTDASSCLFTLINKLSYSPNILDDNAIIGDTSKENLNEYSPSSIYIRLIQLERFFGNYEKVTDLIEAAEKIDPNNTQLNVIYSEVAFTLQEREKFAAIMQDFESGNKLPICLYCIQAIVDSDYATAASEFEKHLSNIKSTPMVLGIQACVEYHFNEIELAQKHLDLAIESLSPSNDQSDFKTFNLQNTFIDVWSVFSLAIASWKMEKWETAERLFEQATSRIKINPYLNYVYADFLIDLVHKFNISTALRIITHAPSIEIVESAPQLFKEQISYANHYLPESLITTSLKVADHIFKGQISGKDDLLSLISNERNAARLLSILDNQDVIKEIASAFPKSFEVQFQHALIMIAEDPNQVHTIIDNLSTTSPKNPKLLALSGHDQTIDLEQQIDNFEKALTLWPDEPEWHAIVANKYWQLGLNDKADQHLEKAITLNPNEFSYFQLLGEIKKKENNLSESKHLFTQAYNLFPENEDVLQALAFINRKLGKNDSAIQCFEQLINLDPSNTTYYMNLADTYLVEENFDKALDISRSVRLSDKANLVAREIEVKAQLGKKNFVEVKRLLEAALIEFPDHLPFRLLDLDVTKMNNGNDAALRKANSLAQKFPEDHLVLMALANSQLESGQLNNAELTFHRILELVPSHPDALVKIGRINRINGNLDHAVDLLSQAIELDMTNIDAYIELGKTYQNRRQHAQAIEIYKKAISIIDSDYRPYLQAGIAYKECKDYRKAETMLRTAATLAPMETSIRRQLASVITLNLVSTLQEAPNHYEQ